MYRVFIPFFLNVVDLSADPFPSLETKGHHS
jgi:hypothetical protein